MAELAARWSHVGGALCIRVSGCGADATIEVRPAWARRATVRPAMVGSVVADGGDRLFLPRYPFDSGTDYEVTVDGIVCCVLRAPQVQAPAPAATEVVSIHPSSPAVPVNLLRFYVRFSQSMSAGYAAGAVRLTDLDGNELDGALLSMDDELWDPERRRLTVLLDPGRIKQGLADHEAAGYPLKQGQPFRLVVDDRFPDASGRPLLRGGERRYAVDGALSGRVRPTVWSIDAPGEGTLDPVIVHFDRTMDHALLARCLRVVGPDGAALPGSATIGAAERSWSLRPRMPWGSGEHRLEIAPVLEDIAGNSVLRPFDRDLRVRGGSEASSDTFHRGFTPHSAERPSGR